MRSLAGECPGIGTLLDAVELMYEAARRARVRVVGLAMGTRGNARSFRILVVDDTAMVTRMLTTLFRQAGWTTECAETLHGALAALRGDSFDLVVLDMVLSDASGAEGVTEVRRAAPSTPIVMLTGHASIASAVACIKAGAVDFVQKPIDDREAFVRLVGLHLARGARAADQQGTGPVIVRGSAVMQAMLDDADRFAAQSFPVLILGETGTGKELVARRIHARSQRSQLPMLAVNCASLSGTLADSVLFGHVRGAFTGATRDHAGLFEQANGATLLLDEVGELPAAEQAKLLRVLDDGIVRRIGASSERRVDVRIIAATNCEPHEAVRRGTFRRDLLHRLSVAALEVPPLRDRLADIPLLVEHTLRHAADGGSGPRAVSQDVLRAFERYAWPGNVRELINVLLSASARCKQERIELGDLLAAVAAQALSGSRDEPPGPTFREYERLALLHALEKTRGNVVQAARVLGVSRSALYRRMARLGVKGEVQPQSGLDDEDTD